MRIGFDVSPLHRPHPPGVVRATRGLVEALERRGRLEVVRLAPPPRARLSSWRQVDLLRASRAHGLHGIHSPVSAFPVLAGPLRVQTIHETPWERGADENADGRHRLWASIGPLRAHAVLCPSASTAESVRAASPLAAHKVHACAWGVDPIFAALPQTSMPQADDDAVLEQLGLERAYVLAPGAVRAKKNLTAVLRGVQHAVQDLDLVVTGPLTPWLLASVARFPTVVVRMVGEVDDRTLAALLRRATAVAVLSTSEGFALPVIEAQACGTPVVVTRGSTQAETAGNAALHVDADDEHEVAAAFDRATAHRARYASAGFDNAARFTWDRCAEQVERIWEAFA